MNVSFPKNDRTTETRVTTERTNRMAVYSQASYTHRVRTRCVDGCQLLFTILDSIAKGQRSNASCISQRERNLSNAIYRNERPPITFSVGPWPSTKTRVARISYISFASLQTRSRLVWSCSNSTLARNIILFLSRTMHNNHRDTNVHIYRWSVKNHVSGPRRCPTNRLVVRDRSFNSFFFSVVLSLNKRPPYSWTCLRTYSYSLA